MTVLTTITCEECGLENQRNRGKCGRCNEKIGSGYPNVNVYSAPYFKEGLAERYAALEQTEKHKQLEEAIQKNSNIVLNLDAKFLFTLINEEEDYLPYRRAVEANKRLIADIGNDHKRSIVDTAFYSSHGSDIVHTALSLDEDGLTSYGDVSVTLDAKYVSKRTSVLERNSFDLYKQLTKVKHWDPADFPPPTGHFATWENRSALAIVKHDADIGKCDNFAKLLLFSESDRSTDNFMELHIFGKITLFNFKTIKFHSILGSKKMMKEWAIAQEKLSEEVEIIKKW